MKTAHSYKPTRQQVKIEIVPENLSSPSYLEEIRWEDDGGQVPDPLHMIDDSELPLKAGDTFKVLSGYLTKENGKIFYIAEIEPVE